MEVLRILMKRVRSLINKRSKLKMWKSNENNFWREWDLKMLRGDRWLIKGIHLAKIFQKKQSISTQRHWSTNAQQCLCSKCHKYFHCKRMTLRNKTKSIDFHRLRNIVICREVYWRQRCGTICQVQTRQDTMRVFFWIIISVMSLLVGEKSSRWGQ